jgi:hypothetical protein
VKVAKTPGSPRFAAASAPYCASGTAVMSVWRRSLARHLKMKN